jgi:aspartyl/asparaginyl beta-hydroxylase (cupin superfamily)
LREESRLRVFENEALRRIFGPERDEVRGVWRRLHNKKLHALEKETLGRSSRRWENDIKMDFQDVGWEHRLD